MHIFSLLRYGRRPRYTRGSWSEASDVYRDRYKTPPKMWDITDDPKAKHKAEYEWLTKTEDEQFDI